MKVEKFNLFVVITTLVVLASIVFTALSGMHIRSTKSAPYKHPCIVLKVDNQGCQTQIEMRTRLAAWQNGDFTD
jgi:outer membrane lipopolysaccharide assembly protein LptE/RlpB